MPLSFTKQIDRHNLDVDLDRVEKRKKVEKQQDKETKEEVKQYGVRNSLLLAPMPTASTSQIFGNNECFEPYTSNIYTYCIFDIQLSLCNFCCTCWHAFR